MFLSMRSTQLIIIRGNRVSMAPSLYLDQHGEVCSDLVFFYASVYGSLTKHSCNEAHESICLCLCPNFNQNSPLCDCGLIFGIYVQEDNYIRRTQLLHLSKLRLNEVSDVFYSNGRIILLSCMCFCLSSTKLQLKCNCHLPIFIEYLFEYQVRRLWVTAGFDHATHILHNSQLKF